MAKLSAALSAMEYLSEDRIRSSYRNLGFSDVDHNVVKDFIGITYEQAGEYWKKLLQYYFEGKDDSYLETVQEKAMVMGFVRLLRREIRRDGLNSESGRKFWRTCQVLSRNLFDFLHILHNKKVVKASILLALTT